MGKDLNERGLQSPSYTLPMTLLAPSVQAFGFQWPPPLRKQPLWVQPFLYIYRSTSLCQTCLSRIHGLCRSDHPFPNFTPILHCNSTLLMSNSVIMKTRLFRSDFSFHKANFPFVYHCLYRSGQKVKRSNDKQSNLPD